MNILWITNITFPEAQALLTGEGSLKASGGWLLGAASALVDLPDVKLTVASLSPKVKRLTLISGEKITYYILPYGKGNHKINRNYELLWKQVRDAVKPDIVHIHGTEYTQGLAYVEACGSNNVCVSIQGLVSVYSRYYYYGFSRTDIHLSVTPASFARGGILSGYRDFVRRGEYEKELLRKINHIIGRTTWDQSHAWAINPNAQYYHGGETLRSVFYSGDIWNYERCIQHRIFLSQGGVPLKGLQQVLRALPLVLRHYPDTTLCIAGKDIVSLNNWRDYLSFSDYGRLIRKIIKKNKLQEHVRFLGYLDGEEMRREYLHCNVFICPSSIENSPNSLGEAQLLGVPVLASYVGGNMDMMSGDEGHLYRFEEFEMLANKIVGLFDSQDSINTEKMRVVALKRHDPQKNLKELMGIYMNICYSGK